MEQGAEPPAGWRECRADFVERETDRAFHRFQGNIACEAAGDDHVHEAGEQVVASMLPRKSGGLPGVRGEQFRRSSG